LVEIFRLGLRKWTIFAKYIKCLVEVLRHKPECRGFDSRWCHWNFSFA